MKYDFMKGWIAIVPLDDVTAASYRPIGGYSFGDHTPHHRHVAVGDIFFIRNQTHLLALGRVQRIEVGQSEKEVQRCPTCGTGQLGFRSTRSNSYRCLYGHEFANPSASVRSGTEYQAFFGLDYIEISARVEAAELRAFELTNSRQLSLRPCDLDGLIRYIARRDRNAEAVLKAWLNDRSVALTDEDADLAEPADVLDEREHRNLGIRLRRGRKVFRDELIRRYGARCMISGCTAIALIEAAYIQPEAVPKFNNPTNGLLLRSDLHTLFDLNLLGIDPSHLVIVIHPDLLDSEYKAFDGRPLQVASGRGPNRRALATRWDRFQSAVAKMDLHRTPPNEHAATAATSKAQH